jgi:hypothetical protein
MSARKTKSHTTPAPAIEAPAPATIDVAVQHPMLAVPSAGPTAKASKGKRYVRKDQDPRFAPLSTIERNAVIKSVLLPNPKRGESAKRYATFYTNAVGTTVQQVIDAYVAAGLTEKLAIDDLRWDTVPHLGKTHLVLDYPVAEVPAIEAAPVTE